MKRDKTLQELYESKITNSKQGVPLRESDKAIFERLVHNEMQYLKEDTFSGDIARIGEILVPVFRRAFPMLIAKDLVGVQPLSQPSGHVFALRYDYKGNYGVGKAGNTSNFFVNGGGKNSGPVGPAGQGQTMSNVTSILVTYSSATAKEVDCGLTAGSEVTAGAAYSKKSAELASLAPTGDTLSGTVIYSEGVVALVYVAAGLISSALALTDVVISTGNTLVSVDYNEAGYLNVFRNYVGPWSTNVGEAKGDDISELGLTIEKILVEAQTRKLRASYTIEAAQDMKSVHGKDLAAELIDIMTYEITQAIDRDLIAQIKSAATPVAAFDVQASTTNGPWTVEKYRNAYTQLVRNSNDIARTTLRGPGNFLIASPDMCTMLETVPGYIIAPILGGGNVDTNSFVSSTGHALVGSMGGRFKVYRDIFTTANEIVIGYKGSSQYDTGVIWSPYVPLTMTKIVTQEAGQPRIVFSERSAISQNPFSADKFYRRQTFTNVF